MKQRIIENNYCNPIPIIHNTHIRTQSKKARNFGIPQNPTVGSMYSTPNNTQKSQNSNIFDTKTSSFNTGSAGLMYEGNRNSINLKQESYKVR